MPDQDVSSVYEWIFGTDPTPSQALQFVKVYNEIISKFTDPNSGLPFDHILVDDGRRKVPAAFVKWLQDPTGKNFTALSDAFVPVWNRYAKIESYAPEHPASQPLTGDEVSVLPTKEYAAATKLRDQSKTIQNPGGTYPTYSSVLTELAAPSLSKADAQVAFARALRAQGILPTKSPEYRKYLSDQFDTMWEETSGADPSTWKSIGNSAELTKYFVDSFTQFPDQLPAEADFLKKFREQDTTGKEFDVQFQQMLSTGQLPGSDNLSPEQLDVAKETLRKQYVDAFYRNPLQDATTIGQRIISGGFAQFAQEVARQAAERDRQFEMAANEGEAHAQQYFKDKAASDAKAAAETQASQVQGSPVNYQAGQRLLPAAEQTQRNTFDALLAKQDSGFQQFLQEQVGTGAESPAFRGIRQGFQQATLDVQAPFNALTQRIRQGGNLSSQETNTAINPETNAFRTPPQLDFAGYVNQELAKLNKAWQASQSMKQESATRGKLRSVTV